MELKELVRLFQVYLKAAGRSDQTIESYEKRFSRWLLYFGPETEIEQIDFEKLDEWAASLREPQELYKTHDYRQTVNKTLSNHSIYAYIQAVKTLLKWTFERGYSRVNLGQHLRKPKLNNSSHNKVINREDLYRLLDAARDSPRDYALMLFLVDTGCRRGEAATVKMSDLALDILEAVVTGKTGQHKVVYTRQTAAALSAWLELRPECDHDFVFTSLACFPVNDGGDPIKPGAINSLFRRLAKRAGITRKVSPHRIRHLIGQIYTDNTNLALAQNKLNHSNIQTTGMFYAHQDTSRVKAATELYSPLNGYRQTSEPDELVEELFKNQVERLTRG